MSQEGKAAVPTARILLVDDEPDTLDLLKHLLSQRYQVEVVTDGLAEVHRLKHLPDLVLADVMMIGLDGFEVLRSLRADPQTNELPIILLSKQVEEEACIAGLEAGADDYVTKPFSTRELLARIEVNLRRAHSRQDAARRERELRAQSVAAERKAEAARDQISNILESISDAHRQATLGNCMEMQLQRSNERFELAAAAVNCLIYDWDVEQDTVERTEGLTRILGYSLAEAGLSSEWWRERVHPEDLQRIQDEAAAALTNGNYYAGEYRIRNKDNQYIYVLDQGLVVARDADGRPVRVVGSTTDISDRKRAEELLRQSEERFQAFMNNSPAAAWITDAEGHIVYLSQTYFRLFEFPTDDAIGKSVFELYPAEIAQQFLDNIKTVAQTNQVIEAIEAAPRTDGTSGDFLVYKFPIADASGQRLIGGVAVDITERKRAEEALQKSEEFNRKIIESSYDCIKVLDLDARLVSMSHRGMELLDVCDFTPFFNTQWLEFWQGTDGEAAQAAVESAKSGGIGRFQGYCPTMTGTPKWWDVIITPILDTEGKPERLLSVSRDITKRKRAEEALRHSEERYRYLAESIPQLVWTANAAGVLLDVNQRWLDFTGLTLAQAQLEGWQAIVHPDDVLILSERWAAAQQDGIHYQAEGRMRRVDGVYRWHLHQAVPMKNERGQVIKWFGTATDIEDQKRLEQQRDLILQQEQAAREEAERANRIKDEFLAVLSHELRSPLNPILGWSKLLRSRKLDENTTNRALETIERSAQVQTQLIEDLLDVSRILQGKLSLNVCPVDLTSIIQAAMETVHLAAVAKSIQIQTWLEPDVGHVSGDPSRLQQVVWNLLSNAVKFTPPGGQVDIRLERLDSQAQIAVSDTGKGIDPDFLPHVFGYFRQSDSTTTRKFGGLGLGLAIARNLVELHGGTLQAESAGEGQGATFRVRLPLISTQLRTNQDSRCSEQSLDLNGLKLLVVDDDASTREFFTFLLELHGASVTAVGSAGEAFAALTQSKPDVLLSDIGMPEVDGYMLMQQVRTLPPEQGGQIPAIALTAYAGEINYQQALLAGFQQHVSKPVEPAKLVEVIANLVGQSR